MSKNIQEAAQRIEAVAKRLAMRNHGAAPELQRIAQYLAGMGEMPMTMPMAMPETMPMAMEYANHGDMHPNISSFVKMKADKKDDDGFETHVCSVTFKAPEGVDQGDIMKAILKICEEIGVEAHGFKWSKSEGRRKD